MNTETIHIKAKEIAARYKEHLNNSFSSAYRTNEEVLQNLACEALKEGIKLVIADGFTFYGRNNNGKPNTFEEDGLIWILGYKEEKWYSIEDQGFTYPFNEEWQQKYNKSLENGELVKFENIPSLVLKAANIGIEL